MRQHQEEVAVPTKMARASCVEQLESQPLYRALFDHAPLAQIITSADGVIERVNPAFTALLGYDATDVCGKSVMAITHPDDAPRSWSSARRVGLSMSRLSFQKRYLHRNGRVVSALVTLSAIELEGCRNIVGQIVDLTPIKQAHSEAESALERLRTAVEAAGAGTWVLDLATGHMEWDDAMRRQFGLAEEDPTPNFAAFLACVDEADRRSVTAAIHNAALPGHGRFDYEYRVHCADGVERWYRGVGRARRDAAGRATGGVGIVFDITATKHAQLDRERMQSALHRAERRLAAIVANSRDAILGASLDLRITSWNGAAEAMFGYTVAEAIGLPVAGLLTQERRARIAERLAMLQAGETMPIIESECLRKDGTRIDVEITIAPVPGDDGRTAWYSGIARDITERKTVERLRAAQIERAPR